MSRDVLKLRGQNFATRSGPVKSSQELKKCSYNCDRVCILTVQNVNEESHDEVQFKTH